MKHGTEPDIQASAPVDSDQPTYEELVAALRPFAEAQYVADLRAARAEADYLLASDHIRPSAFRIARDAVVRIDSRKGSRR